MHQQLIDPKQVHSLSHTCVNSLSPFTCHSRYVTLVSGTNGSGKSAVVQVGELALDGSRSNGSGKSAVVQARTWIYLRGI